MSGNDNQNFIELIPTEESRTARCPAMCQTIIGARILAASAMASNNAIHAVLDAVKARLFDDMVVSTADGPVHTNIFNIYLGKLPRNCVGEIIRGGETYRTNIIPSWSSASSHTFTTVASVSSGTCLFVSVVTVPLRSAPVSS